MTTTVIDKMTFSDGSSLNHWMTRQGAPTLPEGFRWRLLINDRRRALPLVTAQILSGDRLCAEYTEITRVNVAMAAAAAARYAYEGFTP